MAGNRTILFAQEVIIYKCTLCDSVDRVRWFCNECQETLCDRCKEAHTRGKKTQNDDVVPIGQAIRTSSQTVSNMCKTHPDELITMYCLTCKSLICRICSEMFHKLHSLTRCEDEMANKRQELAKHVTMVSTKIDRIQNETSKQQQENKSFNDNIDSMQEKVTVQKTKVKEQVDCIADTITRTLSSMKEIESNEHVKFCQQSEKNVKELKQLLDKALTTDTGDLSLFEVVDILQSRVPLYDVSTPCRFSKQPSFVPGSIDTAQLTKMMGGVLNGSRYQKVDINKKHVQNLSMFRVTQRARIWNICPYDEMHAWLSIRSYKGLVLVNKEGLVSESVELDFCPCLIAMLSSTEILMTRYKSTVVSKLSLGNKQVTTFADVGNHNPWGISVSYSGEVFLCTLKPDVIILNHAGEGLRKFSCETNGKYITCMPTGSVAIALATDTMDGENAGAILITGKAGKVLNKWTGELDSGRNVGKMHLCNVSCDIYDRVFVPDYLNHQVYVVSSHGENATCLLDQKHGVQQPTAVLVDQIGDVWIGCKDGSVHVMRL
ncbi:uncharacterized protein LOC132555627 [Ylistrum balloti]|uniref:uncharacterized protein LOC132555627 n=1 Tax=Ylistrum balloti TaxID=509963 RepID=UPI002905A91D|nr:uncharacterized protein LOC132555627 [Ylistrum balloti]